MKIKPFGKRGITLTEIIFSIALLLLVWLAAVNTVIIGKFSGSLVKHKMQAAYIAQQTIERLRKTPFYQIESGVSTVTIDNNGTPYDTSDDFTGTQMIGIDTGLSPHYKQVIVRIEWNEVLLGKNKTMREYCGTYIADDFVLN